MADTSSQPLRVSPAPSGDTPIVPEPTSIQQGGPIAPPPTADGAEAIGGFRVLHLLGEGGMGKVFHAEDISLNRPVAIKVMHPHLAKEQHARERFMREARSQASLLHDHIVPIWQVGEENQTPFIVMPLLEGQTLESRLRSPERLSIKEIVRIGKEIAEWLQAAHSRGLIHRDIKPANLWLQSPNQRVLILDFGLAREMSGEGITQAGGILGTPPYMSPEQADGRPLDGRSDLFSLGTVLYRMVAGQMPFRGDSTFGLLRQIVEKEPPSLLQLAPTTPQPLAELIQQLLSKNPDARPASAEVVAHLLAQLATNLTRTVDERPTSFPVRSEPTPPTIHSGSGRRSRQRGWIALGIVLLLGAGYLLTRPGGESKPPELVTDFDGKVDVRIWREKADGSHERLHLKDALPLRKDETFRIEATTKSPGYIYLFWIDPNGLTVPVYPWKPGEWGTRPKDERPIAKLNLPEKAGKGWSIDGDESGMETILMLVRSEPLKASDDEIKTWFEGIPAQNKIQNSKSAVWFNQGGPVLADTERAPLFHDKNIKDPLICLHAMLQERLEPQGLFTTAVSFAKEGKK